MSSSFLGKVGGCRWEENDSIKDKLGCIQPPLQMYPSHNGAVMTLSINLIKLIFFLHHF